MGRGNGGVVRSYRALREGTGSSYRAIAKTSSLVSLVMAREEPRDTSNYNAYSVGALEQKIIRRAKAEGVSLASGSLYFDYASLKHSLRHWFDGKSHLAVEPQSLVNLPRSRSSMDVYYDSTKRNFLYVDGVNKYVISNKMVTLKNGKKEKVCLVTAKRLGRGELNMQKYSKV